jgi:tetratricopeptide (TPR) repeat protein
MLALNRFAVVFVILWLSTAISSYGQQDSRPRNANYYFEKGEEALNNKSYKTALAHYNECLRLNPYFMEAYYLRALARDHLGDKQGALTDYNIYLETRPEDKEALFSRAVTRYEFGQWVVAREDFLRLLKLPQGGITNTVYFQTDQSTESASKIFTAHHDLYPTIYNYLGLIELKFENSNKAIHYFDSAIQLNPTDPDLYLHHGLADLQLGDTAKAIFNFEKSLTLNPESSQARINLAALVNFSSSQKDAETLLTEAIEKNPALPYSYSERGLIRMTSGNLSGALEDYDKAVSLAPADPDNWINRGLIKERKNDNKGALADYQQAIKIKSDYEKAWLNHGNALIKLNKPEEAIEDYTVAITLYPEYGLAFYNRGITLHRLGKNSEGCRDIKEAMRLGFKVDAKIMIAICK